jgi:hypothetical protein
MCRKLFYLISFILVLSLMGSVARAAQVAVEDLLVDLRARDLAYGTGATTWPNRGSLGDFTANGTPVVEDVDGRKAVTFDDSSWFEGPTSVPGIEGAGTRSIEVWAYNPSMAGEETMVSWAHRGGPDGTNMAFNYSSNSSWGAVGHWGGASDMGYAGAHSPAPTVGMWWHLVYTYDGTTARIYVNAEEETVLTVALNTHSGNIIRVAAQSNSAGTGIQNGMNFIGSIAEVRIYNRALTQEEIQVAMLSAGEPWPYASMPKPADGAMLTDTWVNLGWRAGDFAVSHDVYIGDNFDDVNDSAESTFQSNQTSTFFVVGFPGFPYPDGLVPGTTYYWRIDEVNDTEPNSPWKSDVWSFMIPPKTAYAPDPADNAESIDPDANLSWTGGFGAKLHTVYFGENFDDVNNAAGGFPQGATTYTPGTLKLAKTYYWRVDEFDAVETYKGHVWSFTTEGAVGNPNPVNGAVDVKQTQIITWSPSVFAASHELYFGTDKDAVKNADSGSPEYKGTRNLDSESYDPGKLEWDSTYYWRVDEVNNANTDSPWVGNLWSFTTANFLVVDDFESYNDLDPDDPESDRIFNAWLDGYGIPTNGSIVGYETPPFAEQTIVHGGRQSMPFSYDNSVGYSEAILTLTYPRDWTEKGVITLTIWFIGDAANAAETLYVALNGNAIVTNDNPNAAQVDIWTEWNIDLQAFADQGVNLTNVNTISLGLGNKNNPLAGGSGMMYFDDIRLYPPPPEQAP